MNDSLRQRATGLVRKLFSVSYEARIRVTLAFVLLLMIITTLNSIRFFDQSKQELKTSLRERATDNLDNIADFLQGNPEEKIKSAHFRDLQRVSGFKALMLVETAFLDSAAQDDSRFVGQHTLERLRAQFSERREVISSVSGAPPTTMSTIYGDKQGGQWRNVYYHFSSNDGEKLTLVAVVDASSEARIEKFSVYSAVFQVVSILAAITVGLILLRITFAPYRRIKTEAIAADIAKPEQAESIDFAVETFQRVIDELKQKEQRLQKLYAAQRDKAASLEKYNRYILESMPTGVISCDTGNRITHFNEAAAAILKINSEMAVGEDCAEVLAEYESLVKMMQSCLAKSCGSDLEQVEIMHSDKRNISLALTCVILRDHLDDIKGAMLLVNDLSEIKRLEDEIKFKEQMASMGEMAAGLAHQLRNAVATVTGFAQLLEKLTAGEGQISQIATSILTEAKSTEQMLSKFMTYAAPGALSRECCSIAEILSDAAGQCRHQLKKRDVELDVDVGSDVVKLHCDRLLITNCFVNLIQNAVEASAAGDVIRVRVVSQHKPGQLQVTVSDSGIGIAPEQVDKIFNPFYTSGKAQGTGLGLSLVKKWILQHRGEVSCSSKLNKGTTFTFLLPLEAEHSMSVSAD